MKVTNIFSFGNTTQLELPLFSSKVPAGFPSPADDFIERSLDLNEFLIKHPAATFFVKVEGESMIGAGIHSEDILIVDRALNPEDKKIVIAILNGELTVKRLRKQNGRIFLEAENQAFSTREITDTNDFQIWGVVTYVIHAV